MKPMEDWSLNSKINSIYILGILGMFPAVFGMTLIHIPATSNLFDLAQSCLGLFITGISLTWMFTCIKYADKLEGKSEFKQEK